MCFPHSSLPILSQGMSTCVLSPALWGETALLLLPFLLSSLEPSLLCPSASLESWRNSLPVVHEAGAVVLCCVTAVPTSCHSLLSARFRPSLPPCQRMTVHVAFSSPVLTHSVIKSPGLPLSLVFLQSPVSRPLSIFLGTLLSFSPPFFSTQFTQNIQRHGEVAWPLLSGSKS